MGVSEIRGVLGVLVIRESHILASILGVPSVRRPAYSKPHEKQVDDIMGIFELFDNDSTGHQARLGGPGVFRVFGVFGG